MKCSYCVIPLARGDLASRPLADIVEEVRRLVDNGHREIVLTGIHLGHWGLEWPKSNLGLADLVEAILALEGPFRVRLSSLEAVEVSQRLLALMADYPRRLCPHLHLPMQSGSDSVLERMQRRWASAQFVEKCLEAKESLPHPALTTDVIVGFPGETDADFEASCRAVEAIGFSKVHVFRFSPRQGAPATEMPNQIEPIVKQRRATHLAEVSDRLRGQFFRSLLGRRLEVLAESTDASQVGRLLGTSARYAPVTAVGPSDLVGQLIEVEAQAATCDGISGTVVR